MPQLIIVVKDGNVVAFNPRISLFDTVIELDGLAIRDMAIIGGHGGREGHELIKG
jgi:hypothetical protein